MSNSQLILVIASSFGLTSIFGCGKDATARVRIVTNSVRNVTVDYEDECRREAKWGLQGRTFCLVAPRPRGPFRLLEGYPLVERFADVVVLRGEVGGSAYDDVFVCFGSGGFERYFIKELSQSERAGARVVATNGKRSIEIEATGPPSGDFRAVEADAIRILRKAKSDGPGAAKSSD